MLWARSKYTLPPSVSALSFSLSSVRRLLFVGVMIRRGKELLWCVVCAELSLDGSVIIALVHPFRAKDDATATPFAL